MPDAPRHGHRPPGHVVMHEGNRIGPNTSTDQGGRKRIIDYIGNVAVTDEGEKAVVDIGGGSAGSGPWLWDYFVHDAYAGTPGTLRTAFGKEYRTYATIDGAISDGVTRFGAGGFSIGLTASQDSSNNYKYLEALDIDGTAGGEIHIYGAGKDRTIIGGPTSQHSIASDEVFLYHLTLEGTTPVLIQKAATSNMELHALDCRFNGALSGDWAGCTLIDCDYALGIVFASGNSPGTTRIQGGEIIAGNIDFSSAASASDWHVTGLKVSGSTQVKLDTCTYMKFDILFGTTTQNNCYVFTGANSEMIEIQGRLPAPGDAGKVIHIETGITVRALNIDSTFNYTTGISDAGTRFIKIEGTLVGSTIIAEFDKNSSGNYLEDDGGISIEGECVDCKFILTPPSAQVKTTGASSGNIVDSGTIAAGSVGIDYAKPGDHGHTGTGDGGDVDHADLTNVTSDQHHAESHTVASHSDTTATGAELETLTDGSNADSLHAHSLVDTNTLLDGSTHTDTAAATVTRGSIIVGNSTPAWDELVMGSLTGSILRNDGSDVGWSEGTDGRLRLWGDDDTLSLEGQNTNDAQMQIVQYGSGSASLILGKSGGDWTTPTDITSGTAMGNLFFGGWRGSLRAGPEIRGVTTENWAVSAQGSKLEFLTVPDSSATPTLALTLDQDQSASFEGHLLLSAQSTLGLVAADTGRILVQDSGTDAFMLFDVGGAAATDEIRWRWGRLSDADDVQTDWLRGDNTANAVMTLVHQSAGSEVGQLQLPVTGSSAGLLLGGDALIYRSAANVVAIGTGDDLHMISGNITLSASATVDGVDVSDHQDRHAASGADPLYSLHTYVFVPDAAKGEDVTTGDAQGSHHHSLDNAETVIGWIIDAETAPTGAALIIQIEYADTDDLDTASTWTEIDRDSLAAGSQTVKFSSGFTNSSIPANRLIRMNVDQVGSTAAGKDVAVHLIVKRPLSV